MMNPLPSKSPSPQPQRARPTMQPRMSKMAVTGLVLALIPCCPFVSMAGSLLGAIALRRIQSAGGMLSGRRVAQTALVSGLIVAALSTLVLSAFYKYADQANNEILLIQIENAVRFAANGQPEQALKTWVATQSEQPTVEAVMEFGEQSWQRYGRLQRFMIASTASKGSTFQRQFDVAGIFVFDRRELTGSASFLVQASPGKIWPQFRLRSLVIEDFEQGHLRLPPDA